VEKDDLTVGRVLNRREALAVAGMIGAGALSRHLGGPWSYWLSAVAPGASEWNAPLPTCVVRPGQTEGPYFVDQKLNRSDIRSDPARGGVKEGALLALEVRVARIARGSCAPLVGALVDIWQCDALGVYSDVRDANGFFDTRGQKFLRGYQVTDAAGVAKFTTVYPGWYDGRTVHVHFKVRTPSQPGRSHEFTSQLYFDDALTDQVHSHAPYASKGPRTVRNARDGIYRQGGELLTLAVQPSERGYAATFVVGMDVG